MGRAGQGRAGQGWAGLGWAWPGLAKKCLGQADISPCPEYFKMEIEDIKYNLMIRYHNL